MAETPGQIETAVTEGVKSRAEAWTDTRRGSRLAREIEITVSGTDALRHPFCEPVKTVTISCYGCKYSSKYYVPKGSVVTLEIRPCGAGPEARLVRGRVAWVQRPRNYREEYQVAIDLEVPGNIWGIVAPPDDWFAHPVDLTRGADEVPSAERELEAVDVPHKVPAAFSALEALLATRKSLPSGEVAPPEDAIARPPEAPAESVEISKLCDDSDLPPSASFAPEPNALPIEEVVAASERLDGGLEETVARAVKLLGERIARSVVDDFVRDATSHALAVIARARREGTAAAESLDARIRRALDEAVAEPSAEALASPKSARRSRKATRRKSV